MQILSSTNRLLMLGQFMLTDFAPWYVLEKPKSIVADYFSYLRAVTKVIGFTFLLKTLFSPWKNIVDEYPSSAFDLVTIIQVWSSNLVSRFIGCSVRLFFIAFGIVVEIALLIYFTAYLLLWLLFPVLSVIAVRHILLLVL